MTLDEAIKRELDIVKRSERKAAEQFPEPYSIAHKTCMQCAEDHRQLAEWLTELKERRVRCKDCKYNSNTCGNYVNCDIIPQMFGRTVDNFCSMAKRKENDET